MDPIDAIPPVVRILLEESPDLLGNPKRSLRQFKKLIPELKRQAAWTLDHFGYIDEADESLSDRFLVNASGPLDPFSRRGLCSELKCRIATAVQFARTLGVYTDAITVTDVMTAQLINKRLSTLQLESLFTDTVVLKTLEPLIREGIVRFRAPWRRLCADHYQEFQERIDQALPELTETILPGISCRLLGKDLLINTDDLFGDAIAGLYSLSDDVLQELSSGKSIDVVGRDMFTKKLRTDLMNVFIDLSVSRAIDAPLFSSSRFDLMAIRVLDSANPEMRDIELWENARSISLPWIKGLQVQDIVRLRHEAKDALPRFREKMHGLLSNTCDDPHSRNKAIVELKTEAVEIASELEALKLSSERRFRNIIGALGISFSVYGFAAGFVPETIAIGSLISLLGLIHGSARKDEQESQKLKSKPAYVLLKGKEIAAQHHHSR